MEHRRFVILSERYNFVVFRYRTILVIATAVSFNVFAIQFALLLSVWLI